MKQNADFTQGKILGPLMRFMLPVLMAMLLQDFYGVVDLFIVGRFAETADVSGVTTGAQLSESIFHRMPADIIPSQQMAACIAVQDRPRNPDVYSTADNTVLHMAKACKAKAI